MPKRKEQKYNENNRPVRKSEFDPEREAFMDGQGNYTYNTWVQLPNGLWELKPICTAMIGEEGVTAEITIALDDADCEVDRQNNQIRKHRDKVFEDQCAAYDADPTDENGDKRIDPWDKPYAQKKFIQQVLTSCPGAEKGVDKTGRRRIVRRVKIGDALD